MLDDRKKRILEVIIREHIKTKAPISSGILVDKYKLGISPATVRNEMADLEEDGWIRQPHTSAGRVPTEKAFKFFVQEIKEKRLAEAEAKILQKLLAQRDELSLKQLAKELARVSNNAVFLAFHKNSLYYTGISNLLQQPEFMETNVIYDISDIIDRFDDIIARNFEKINSNLEILIGSEGPFSNLCSSITFKCRIADHIGLVGILGPMRMDYEKNISLMNFIREQMMGTKDQ